jgi:hypothetical protein
VVKRGRKRGPVTTKVSGNIPAWKAHLAEVLCIPPTHLINLGYDLGIENFIHFGKGYQSQIALYIQGLEAERTELMERINAARKILEARVVKESAAQLRIWDSALNEEQIIPARKLDPEKHKVLEEIRT